MVEDDAISSVTVLGGSGMGKGVGGLKSCFLAGSLSGLAGKLEVIWGAARMSAAGDVRSDGPNDTDGPAGCWARQEGFVPGQ